MKRITKIVVILAMSLLPVFATSQSSILKGRIYDAGSFENVSFATITVRNSKGAIVAIITTGYDGQYVTDSINAGAYRIEVFSSKYREVQISNIFLQESKVAVIDVALTSIPDAEKDEDLPNGKTKTMEKVFGGIFKAALSAL